MLGENCFCAGGDVLFAIGLIYMDGYARQVTAKSARKGPAEFTKGISQQAHADGGRIAPEILLVARKRGELLKIELLNRVNILTVWQTQQKPRQSQADIGRFW